ncbi:molybdenum cofactor biosynthesis protein [Wenyingzhuangia fucanilytica]|uniref:Molybdopterin molybdenumtransferase n=1 Tax=Wenyingzhuangia fucanilytica TaxID=1790137 RepID=A0A1B1Y2R7_9FLAO|nr:gephyrin-like molybdotransferase Glp [Wenyingzhuangia fucanilytica]ANW95027.1 molybdenum cofactor biosynthesis protein [Wenyingzhuangia fucanilytica]
MNNYLVSIKEAINLVNTNVLSKKPKKVLLKDALDLFLAEDIFSPINMPPFNQSAMDGYAILYDDKHQNNFKLVDEIKAGDNNKRTLNTGEAVRIFTGAPTPINANAVIMQENTEVNNGVLKIDDTLSDYKNIRLEGEQIKQKQIALQKGEKLNPAAIGFLATLGITEVSIYPKPNISIIVTGNELVTPGTPLEFGQIYESNAIMLQTALAKKGFNKTNIIKVKDDYAATKNTLATTLKESDVVLISGGISVGDYDFVGKALLELKTEQIFYKIKQKPGKPLFFGKNQNTVVFALPGNPASALTCYYIYIESALQKIIGNPNYSKSTVELTLENEYLKKGTRGEFLKAKTTQNGVEILGSQSSAMLNSFAQANALIYLEDDIKIVKKGEKVKTYIID